MNMAWRRRTELKVYLAVPIIGGRDLDGARSIASVIGSLGHDVVSSWVLAEDPGFKLSATDVFKRDLSGVEACDVLVAEITLASHGVGMEAMAAHFGGKRILLLHRRGAKISRMLLGIPGATLIECASIEEMTKKLRDVLLSFG
jgi:hypothetical protein